MRQFIFYCYWYKGHIDGFVWELTVAKWPYKHLMWDTLADVSRHTRKLPDTGHDVPRDNGPSKSSNGLMQVEMLQWPLYPAQSTPNNRRFNGLMKWGDWSLKNIRLWRLSQLFPRRVTVLHTEVVVHSRRPTLPYAAAHVLTCMIVQLAAKLYNCTYMYNCTTVNM